MTADTEMQDIQEVNELKEPPSVTNTDTDTANKDSTTSTNMNNNNNTSTTSATAGSTTTGTAAEFEPPLACVRRMLKNTLPSNTNVGKDASSAFSRACGIFVIYLTACANDFARESKRQTITSADIMAAIKELDFGEFEPQLSEFLENHRKAEKQKRDMKKSEEAAKNKRKDSLEPSDDDDDDDDIDGDEESEESPSKPMKKQKLDNSADLDESIDESFDQETPTKSIADDDREEEDNVDTVEDEEDNNDVDGE